MRIPQGETDSHELLHLAFQLYDIEKGGTLTLDDLIQVTETIGEAASREELQEMMNEAFGVRPGEQDAYEITEEQFYHIMERTSHR